jgi:nitroreductase
LGKVRHRRSICDFFPTQNSPTVVQEALEEAQRARSNCDTQPWDIHILSNAKRPALARALQEAREAEQCQFSSDEVTFHGRHGKRRPEHGKF